MFDEVPAHFWMLVPIAVIAVVPARYIYMHVVHDPERRDITQPPPDVSWRNSNNLIRNVAFLVGLAGLALVLSIPGAGQILKDGRYWPALMFGFGAWSIASVVRAFGSGHIQPFLRGFNNTYDREAQPRQFWASMAWNTVFGCFWFWLLFGTGNPFGGQSFEDRCYQEDGGDDPQQALNACNQLVKQQPKNSRAHLYRGLLFLNDMKLDAAISDFTRAHELNPPSPWPLANRGMTYAWKNDRELAEEDFKAVRAVNPTNKVMVRGEAMLSIEAGDLEGAIDRLNAYLAEHPDDRFALRLRSDAYQQRGDFAKAQADREKLLSLGG
jgi:tetratricopeptide (TPR) repeat protein